MPNDTGECPHCDTPHILWESRDFSPWRVRERFATAAEACEVGDRYLADPADRGVNLLYCVEPVGADPDPAPIAEFKAEFLRRMTGATDDD